MHRWRSDASRCLLVLATPKSCALAVGLLLAGATIEAQTPPRTEAVLAQGEASVPLKQFSKDLGENFAALWSGDNIRPLLAGAASAVAAIPADDPITNFFHEAGRWQRFDSVGKQIGKSHLLGSAIGVSLLVSKVTKDADYQRFTYSLAQGFVLNNALTGGVKALSRRCRPDATSRFSFPSGHTSNSFVWATVVSRHYGWKAGAPAYIVAGYVGASRLRSRKHFLTDVVAGATLGYIVGRTVTRSPQSKPRRFHWSLSVPPGGGAVLSIGVRVR